MKTKYFDFDFTENSLEIKEIPFSTKQIVINLLFCVFMFALFVFLAVVSFIGHLPVFFKIAGPTAAVIPIVIGVDTIFHGRYRPSVLIYRIDSFGITQKDVKTTYKISWQELLKYGFVDSNIQQFNNHGHLDENGRDEAMQLCLYFAKKEYTEEILRKKFHVVRSNMCNSYSTDDIIVFGFHENFIAESLYLRIMEIIKLYCDDSKRADFLRINNLP